MRRLSRRFWTLLTSAGAALVLAAAVASGLFQLAVEAVPGYRADVERYVRESTGHPIRIGALGLTWRFYYPSLELLEVALLGDDGETVLLEAERLRLGLGWVRLVRGDVTPNRVELHGLSLNVRMDRNGRIQVEGMEQAAAGDPAPVLRELSRFERIRLERCRLNLRLPALRAGDWSFGLAYADLQRGLFGTRLRAELTLPAAFGDTALLDATVAGDPLQPETWSGRATAELSGISAGPWLDPVLAPGARLEFSGVEAVVQATLKEGRLQRAGLELSTGPVAGRRARHRAGVEGLDAEFELRAAEDGWEVEVEQLRVEGAGGTWDMESGLARYRDTGAEAPVIEARAERLRLADLAPWLAILRLPADAGAFEGAGGELRDLVLRVQGRGDDLRYRVQTRFEQLSLPAAGRAAGFSGAAGELAADEAGGRVLLEERPLTLELPGLLLTPTVPIEALDGEFEWRRDPAGWRLQVPQFRWRLSSIHGGGNFELILPDDRARSPVLDLHARFAADDATAAKPLIPRAWGTGLQRWLDSAVVSARATSADLVIRGPLDDFPFAGKEGTFALDIEADRILLAYQPDWPPVTGLAAHLKFRGNSLTIDSTQGAVSGNPIRSVTARFADFSEALLVIDGKVDGEAGRLYDFLARSPLRRDVAGLIERTSARGPAAVDIHLEIPLEDAARTRVAGEVALDGIELRHRRMAEPIRNIRGRLRFGDQGTSAERLSARLYELPLEAALIPQPDGSTRVRAGFRMELNARGQGASALVPAWIRRKVRGAGAWQADLAVGGAEEAPVMLTTDLSGVTVDLPPPLGKPAEAAVPLRLGIGEGARGALRITVDYQDRFGADLHLVERRRGTTLRSAALRLGAGPLIEATEPGTVIGGSLAELDVEAWREALRGAGLEQVGEIRRADLHVGRLRWGAYSVREARHQWAPAGDGWVLSLVGAGGAGEVRWSGPGRGTLGARLDHLRLDYQDAGTNDDGPTDPSQLPKLDLDIQRLSIGDAALGHLRLAADPLEHGLRLAMLNTEGGIVTLSGEGEWTRAGGASAGRVQVELASSDIARLLRAAAYTPNLDAKATRMTGDLRWAPAPGGLDWAQAQGNVRLEFENGQLRAVEPGAGRVLGLVNFYALPRRLTLNFRDVLSSGLGFDRITGDFVLGGGDARSDNLSIVGPSLRMDVRGRIGLAARDYEQIVTVYPDVSAGVTLGAVLLGGPVAGVLTLIAQEILEKPLDQVTQLSYRVTGSWDNPQVQRLPGEPPKAAAGGGGRP